jgi:chromate transporter
VTDAAAAAPRVAAAPRHSILEIFAVFLQIGATSFGGGVVAYLRNALVTKKKWLTDVEFLELMSLSNTLPGLNATNMSILAGQRLRGPSGAIAAMLGMCLPSFILMTAAGFAYGQEGGRPLVTAMLRGVAAAATGLIAATWFQIGKKTVKGFYDGFFILAAVLGINYFKLSVPVVLLSLGAVSIFTYRPSKPEPHPREDHEWIKSLQ